MKGIGSEIEVAFERKKEQKEAEEKDGEFRILVSRVDAHTIGVLYISASLQIIQMYVNIRYNNRFSLSEKEA